MSIMCISLFWPNFYVSQLFRANSIIIVQKTWILYLLMKLWNKNPSQVVYFSKILEIFSNALMTRMTQKQQKYKTPLKS